MCCRIVGHDFDDIPRVRLLSLCAVFSRCQLRCRLVIVARMWVEHAYIVSMRALLGMSLSSSCRKVVEFLIVVSMS